MTDFKQAVVRFASNISEVKKCCKTEEGTKHSLILPMLQLLGYNVFDPTEVVPEVDCDIKRNGDKVDYVIQHNGQHLILIECKHWNKDLDYYERQLRGYFVGSEARFGVLTNGIEYRFFTDLDKSNLMDEKPFLVVYLDRLTEEGLNELEMFCKDVFNERLIIEKAQDLKCLNALRKEVYQELTEPSFDLVTYFARRIYGQVPSKAMRERMQPLLKQTIMDYTQHVEYQHSTPSHSVVQIPQNQAPATPDVQGILSVVQDILSGIVQPSRISMFNGSAYSVLRLDGSEWFPILKFRWTEFAKWVCVGRYNPTTYHYYCNQQKDKTYIGDIKDIHNFATDIRDIVGVMLSSIAGESDEKRAEWVLEHRPDWNN